MCVAYTRNFYEKKHRVCATLLDKQHKYMKRGCTLLGQIHLYQVF